MVERQAGQRGLDDLIDLPGLAQLRQRTRLRQRLEALTIDETFDYIKHRLEIAGADADAVFDPDAIREVHRLSFGVPRLINTLCDTALMCCMVEKESSVTIETIDTVVSELRWQWFEDRDQEISSHKKVREAVQTDMPVTLTVSRAGKFVEEMQTRKAPFIIGRRASNDLVLIDKEKTMLPLIGWVSFGSNWSRSYLAQTILSFWSPSKFSIILKENGFDQVRAVPLTGGLATLYMCRRPETS